VTSFQSRVIITELHDTAQKRDKSSKLPINLIYIVLESSRNGSEMGWDLKISKLCSS